MKMLKNKTAVLAIIILALILFVSILSGFKMNAYADSNNSSETNENQEIDTHGIYTALSISINGGDGRVWTTVKNDVTIFPSTVIVIVELYSSDTYQESYLNMKLEARANIDDLNMGQTITATASTGGVAKYWQGRAHYKVDNNAWKDLSTGTCKIGANGEYLGVV